MKYFLIIVGVFINFNVCGNELNFDIGIRTTHFDSLFDQSIPKYNEDNKGFGLSYKDGLYVMHLGLYMNSYYEKSKYFTLGKFVTDNTYYGLTVANGYADRPFTINNCCIISPMLGYKQNVTKKTDIDLIVTPMFFGIRQSFKY
jgi:hypothetical protein